MHRQEDGVHALGHGRPAHPDLGCGTAGHGRSSSMGAAYRPGTINIIVSVPMPLSEAAYVNAVMTATEAKTQAVLEAGFRATGTVVGRTCASPPLWLVSRAGLRRAPVAVGARIARAVHAAVHIGALRYAAAADTGRDRAALAGHE